MTPAALLLLSGGLLLVLLAWTVWTLTRLNRLDVRVARSWTVLDTQLQRRAGLAEDLARNYPGALGEDRVARLTAAAVQARTPMTGDREQAENALGRELRELSEECAGIPTAVHTELAGTSTRVALARRFYNDAVRDIRALRERRLPRVLHLHRSRPEPRYFDIDDRLATLAASGGPPVH